MGKPYSVSRSILVHADPARVHALINDFRQWTTWSPWEDRDPALERTYRGPESGTGAEYEWSGNREAGSGTMRITNTTDDAIAIDLTFRKPFPARNRLLFTLSPVSGGTKVTWGMEGELSTLMGIMTRIRPMDAFIGPDFERGLEQLKRAAEN